MNQIINVLKNSFLGLVAILLSSCYGNNSCSREIDALKKENDSLAKIVREINSKYVFDSIFLKTIPDPKNSLKINSDYRMDILLVAYGLPSKYFINNDSSDGDKKVTSDTLIQRNGTFKFRTKLREKVNYISINVNVDNKFGKSIKGKLSDVIQTKQ